MQRAPPINTLLSLSRRGYAASAGAEVQQRAPAAMAARINSGAEGGSTAASNKEIFWMRDPKTGYWMPENRFAGQVDAAELRAQLLARKG